MRLTYKKRVQKILNRRINSWRASIACVGFIRLSIFSRRSRSIAASSRTSWLRAFHFAYLPAPMPSASSTDTIQMDPDGSSVETYYDPDGTMELTGDLEMDGTDSIDYSDGSSESVDVDTGEPASDDPGSDGSDRSRKAARRHALILKSRDRTIHR